MYGFLGPKVPPHAKVIFPLALYFMMVLGCIISLENVFFWCRTVFARCPNDAQDFFDDAQHDAHIFDDAQEPPKGGIGY